MKERGQSRARREHAPEHALQTPEPTSTSSGPPRPCDRALEGGEAQGVSGAGMRWYPFNHPTNCRSPQ